MRTAVLTVVAGRHDHLRGQLAGLGTSPTPPDLHVVVSMGDAEIEGVVGDRPRTVVVELPVEGGRLPLAQARNLAASTALDAGAELLVFLDVDCIPAPDLLRRYALAAGDAANDRALLAGPVCYLPPPPPTGYVLTTLDALAEPHAARPAPAPGTVLVGDDHLLFWSLSFAVTAPTWLRLGGFHEGYRGYGGEDTDLAELARTRGIGLRWVGGAVAYHQHHSVSRPPVEHVDDILENAATFHQRWGWWPMLGWLEAFEDAGLVAHDRRLETWVRVAPAP